MKLMRLMQRISSTLTKSLNLDQLGTFSEVVELGSFSAAAERLGISQPAVSLQIRQLERQLGVRLIERVGRRAQATPAGADLLIHARRIKEEVAGALEAITPHRSGTLGRVRIGTGATACIWLLPPVLRRLREQMPGLEITVHTGNTSDILKRLEANALDLALVTLPIPGRSFHVTKVYDDELVALFPANEEVPSRPVTPTFLAGKPLLLYESGGSTRGAIDRWFSRAGCAPKPVMELGSVEAIKQLVGAGLGWAVLPSLALGPDETPQHVATRALSPRLQRSLGIVLRRDKHLNRGLRAVVDELQRIGPSS
jgi:DNA-binding transcriptional LysR family regulator